jgi:hypothetical protein
MSSRKDVRILTYIVDLHVNVVDVCVCVSSKTWFPKSRMSPSNASLYFRIVSVASETVFFPSIFPVMMVEA